MRAVLAGLAGFALIVVLAGCDPAAQPAGPATPPSAPPAGPPVGPPKYVAASCPAPSNEPGTRAVGPFGGRGGTIPAGFQPAWVLRCPIEVRDLPGKGQWQVQVTERADVDVAQATALLAKLRQPSQAHRPGEICTSDLVAGPYYALVDAHGTAIEPAIPVNGCDKPKPDVTTMLDNLPYRELSTLPEAPLP